MQNDLDAFRETLLDNVQSNRVAALRKRFGALPRKVWVSEAGSNRDKARTCLRVALSNGHYVGYGPLCSLTICDSSTKMLASDSD